jgi:hypothetical protein
MKRRNPKHGGSNIENTVYLELPSEQANRQLARDKLVGVVALRTYSNDYVPCESHIMCPLKVTLCPLKVTSCAL